MLAPRPRRAGPILFFFFPSLWLLSGFLLPPARAHEPHRSPHAQLLPRGVRDGYERPAIWGTRTDTVWFGGHDGAGYAVEGSVWDFEGEGGGGDFQGWTSVDQLEDPETYFARVSAADFLDDPCSPMMGFGEYQIWCGLHEARADELDYVTGMGYGNHFCQLARSPRYPAGDVAVAFDYFNDTEYDWDYTYLNVLCYDAGGDPVDDGELELGFLSGMHGAPEDPHTYAGSLSAEEFPEGTAQVQLEIEFNSDGAWSDEDGLYDCVCGAFAADNIDLTIGDEHLFADFEDGADGFTFQPCEGVGTYMGLVGEGTYAQWLDDLGLSCTCTIDGWALEFADEESSPYPLPGHPEGQWEMAVSPIVDRGDWGPGFYNTTTLAFDQAAYLTYEFGAFYRPGYRYYPFTSEANPEPHWSPRMGQNQFVLTGEIPVCGVQWHNLSTLDGMEGDPLPSDWEQMRVTYELYCDCLAFGLPSYVCINEGNTRGTPLLDNLRVGLCRTPDAPPIALPLGHEWTDGYGQRYPTFLEPADVGNANIVQDLSPTNAWPDPENDWHGDSAMVSGAQPQSEETRWLAELCLHIERKGPRQDLIPEYLEWKNRLTGDPEADFVCVLMDSMETNQGVWANKFESYFHEDDSGFDPAHPDRCTRQEILPDSIWTPGTAIRYYYRSFWYNGGAPPVEYFITPPSHGEFEILPRMRLVPGAPYEVQWPAILYVDAYNRGGQTLIEAALSSLGLEWDRYDYEWASSGLHTPLARSHGGSCFNPGGYGNNGLTLEQARGYRLILLDGGTFGLGSLERRDWPLFRDWLDATACGLGEVRRGLIFTGDGLGTAIASYVPAGAVFLSQYLGAEVIDPSLREHADFWEDCVPLAWLDPPGGPSYAPALPLTAFGNGCPNTHDFDVLGSSGAEGAAGNFGYAVGTGTTEFAEIIRDRVVPGESNWRSALLGTSLIHLSHDGCQGETCSRDSACVVAAAADFLGSTIEWMFAGADPLEPWHFRCETTGAPEVPEVTHLTGPGTYLFPIRPNPIQRTATLRFRLAEVRVAQLHVYDVTGRRVRTIRSQELPAGQEHSLVWDGADARGRPVSPGIYWVQLETAAAGATSRRLLVVR